MEMGQILFVVACDMQRIPTLLDIYVLPLL